MTTTTTAPPLFGVRKDPVRLCEFRLRSERNDGTETDHPFTARAQIDAGTALAASRSVSSGGDAAYLEKFLIRVLVDDDGVGQRVEPEPADDEDEPGAEVELRNGSALAFGDWAVDGKTFPSKSLAEQYADENGSSLRRFAKLMDDPFETIQLDALIEVFTYLLEQSGRRPTVRSSPSPRRRTQKPRR